MKATERPGFGSTFAPAGGGAARLARWLVPVLIFLATGAAFVPALRNEFVDWDDTAVLLENPHYRGLGWAQLRWMFTAFHVGHYHPLTWISFGLDYLVWGMEPFGYHLTNLLLHGLNGVLFYFLTLRLLCLAVSGSVSAADPVLRMASGFAALLFTLHPLRVESVAWATERRDVLSALFLLGCLLCYLRAAGNSEKERGRRRWLVAAVIFYGLSLLSKAAGITFPIVLLALDVYPLRRFGGAPGRWMGPEGRRALWEKAPFFLLGVSFGIVALLAQHEAGTLRTISRHGFSMRLAQAVYGSGFYLWKTVFPFRLSPLYEIPVRLELLAWPLLGSAVGVLALSTIFVATRRRWPAGLAVWISYLAILAPVLGAAQSGPQLVADRYSYLSCLGWAVLAGAGLSHLWRSWLDGHTRHPVFFLATAAGVAAVVGLGALTWRQTQVWHDTETLWRQVVAAGQKSRFAHNNLGLMLSGRGETEGGIEHFREALEIDPEYVTAHYNLGNTLLARGNLDEAAQHFKRALDIEPSHIDARLNLGIALAKRGELESAVRQFRRALEIAPAYSEAHFNLAIALAKQELLGEAVEHFQAALKAKPDFAEAHEGLGRALALQGKRAEAIQHYQEALRILKSRPEGAAAR